MTGCDKFDRADGAVLWSDMTREAYGAAGLETERKCSDAFAKHVAL